mmetsp:Transcript_26910/g.86952  ORF Transcript_26910/g.86952 Transcript_26910/m.86952 type:complete len:221 (-) Transcript_26910:700-1362(-)
MTCAVWACSRSTLHCRRASWRGATTLTETRSTGASMRPILGWTRRPHAAPPHCWLRRWPSPRRRASTLWLTLSRRWLLCPINGTPSWPSINPAWTDGRRSAPTLTATRRWPLRSMGPASCSMQSDIGWASITIRRTRRCRPRCRPSRRPRTRIRPPRRRRRRRRLTRLSSSTCGPRHSSPLAPPPLWSPAQPGPRSCCSRAAAAAGGRTPTPAPTRPLDI